MELATWQAIAISVASLAFGWVAYTTLCRVFVNANQTLLMVGAVPAAGGDVLGLYAGVFGACRR